MIGHLEVKTTKGERPLYGSARRHGREPVLSLGQRKASFANAEVRVVRR